MVNQQFTFAVHIMTALACAPGLMDSQTLAASVNTNPVVVRRLLLALRRAGLIETQAGQTWRRPPAAGSRGNFAPRYL